MIKNYESLVSTIVLAMQEQAKEAGTNKAEVDISGGVDSAVIAALACRAFGSWNVIGVYSSINSSEESHKRAKLVAEKFCFPLVELDLSNVYEEMKLMVKKEFERLHLSFPDEDKNRTAFGGFRSCLRAPVGRFVNRMFGGGIREGTGNMDEDELLRFFQKGGDGEVDSNWIEGLYKGEVWELAAYLGVPKEVISAAPTPDLWAGKKHTDEEELTNITGVAMTYTRPGFKMGTIEWVSRENRKNGIITGCYSTTDPKHLGYNDDQAALILAVRKMEKTSRHKATLPPYVSREKLIVLGCVE